MHIDSATKVVSDERKCSTKLSKLMCSFKCKGNKIIHNGKSENVSFFPF